MIRNPFYLSFGLMLLTLTGAAEYRGWSLSSVNEVKNVPRSVRDNPGAYRSSYLGYHRYAGGK
jgi:hypothetical protein